MNTRVNYYVVESKSIDFLAFPLLREAKEFILKNYSSEESRIYGKSSKCEIINFTLYKPTCGFSRTVNY